MKHPILLIVCSTLSAAIAVAAVSWLDDEPYQLAVSPPAVTQNGSNGARTQFASSSTLPLPSNLTEEELINIKVYEGANRGVVNIVTRTVGYDRFFMLATPGEGAGSGSVIDKRGHIVTNYHVVEGARDIVVTLNGKDYSDVEVVGVDPDQDIAVLKVDAPASEMFPVPIGTSDNLKVGQRVFALGNPFGLEGTITTGIISNVNRTLPSRTGRDMKSIIQTDAAMNPGNSGGPLLDTSGRMVGMNVAIAAKAGQSAGLGFAIPVNRIRQIVPQLIEHGRVVRADIGIIAVNEIDEGLQIVKTNRGGPADKAGLRGWRTVERRVRRGPLVYTVEQDDRSAADVIIAVDGEPVESASAFVEMIEEHEPGDTVVLTIIRQGERMRVPVTLGSS